MTDGDDCNGQCDRREPPLAASHDHCRRGGEHREHWEGPIPVCRRFIGIVLNHEAQDDRQHGRERPDRNTRLSNEASRQKPADKRESRTEEESARESQKRLSIERRCEQTCQTYSRDCLDHHYTCETKRVDEWPSDGDEHHEDEITDHYRILQVATNDLTARRHWVHEAQLNVDSE